MATQAEGRTEIERAIDLLNNPGPLHQIPEPWRQVFYGAKPHLLRLLAEVKIRPSFTANVQQEGKTVFWIDVLIGLFGTDTIKIGSVADSLPHPHVDIKVEEADYGIDIDL